MAICYYGYQHKVNGPQRQRGCFHPLKSSLLSPITHHSLLKWVLFAFTLVLIGGMFKSILLLYVTINIRYKIIRTLLFYRLNSVFVMFLRSKYTKRPLIKRPTLKKNEPFIILEQFYHKKYEIRRKTALAVIQKKWKWPGYIMSKNRWSERMVVPQAILIYDLVMVKGR